MSNQSMFNSSNCDAFICCGDLNTSFERDNAITYHKKIAKHITHIKSTNRRVCGIILNYENFFSCMLLNLYLPCDNFSNVQTTDEYINCIEYVERIHV